MMCDSTIRTGALTPREEWVLSLHARIQRLMRWEFWPAIVVYAPLLPYLVWLAIRHGGLRVCTLANPAVPLGGLVGESKSQLLKLLPDSSVVPTFTLEPGPLAERVRAYQQEIDSRDWVFPLIFKPDIGERGTAVRLIKSSHEARAYLALKPERIIVQKYHPGPFEAGIFYIRIPGEKAGRIFSITDKRFPSVTGDGNSGLRALIWRHERYRLQAHVFLERLGQSADRVPAAGELVGLGFAGNHCRGTLFLDGSALITPELAAGVDAIFSESNGFYFGRLDVRYFKPDDLRRGVFAPHAMQIVEVNGLSSESTNMYDPSIGFWKGQRILREQWKWAFQIGAEVKRRGLGSESWQQVINVARWWLLERRKDQINEQPLTIVPKTAARTVPIRQSSRLQKASSPSA